MGMILRNDIYRPPPDLTISQWADEFREIPPEAASEPGHWSTSRAPYQRGMMDAISDMRVDRVVMMTAAQVGKTELLLNTIGYYIDKEPAPILLLQPTIEMGESFSKDRLATMLRDCTCLHGKVKDPRARDSGNTLLHKTFPGGHITIAGANSPASLASRPIRVLLCDEVDRYPVSAGTEGDPVSLAMKRTQNFWNRRIVIVSTPTVQGHSRIETEYEQSTKEEWTLPCPVCGAMNPLAWERLVYEGVTEPVLRCESCGNVSGEYDWKAGQLRGEWRAGGMSKIRGFHVNALASPWVSWPEIVRQYDEAYRNGDETLKVWRNTVLGLPYEVTAGTIDIESMQYHMEDYGAELPDGVLILTAGVDTQENRLEVEVVGHGLRNETWGIEYRRIYGDPGGPEVWKSLDNMLNRSWSFADGTSLRIACACIDSAGHNTDDVYSYCKGKERRNIFPIVGRGKFGRPSVSKPTTSNRAKVYLFTLGVSTIKGDLYSRLNAEPGQSGYCHFPVDGSRGYDKAYYAGLLSERMVVKRRRGQEYITWEPRSDKVRNEPLDCRVYAIGAYRILNPDLRRHMRDKPAEESPGQPKEEKKPVVRKRRILRRGFRL